LRNAECGFRIGASRGAMTGTLGSEDEAIGWRRGLRGWFCRGG
jgi:hypothetical protein